MSFTSLRGANAGRHIQVPTFRSNLDLAEVKELARMNRVQAQYVLLTLLSDRVMPRA